MTLSCAGTHRSLRTALAGGRLLTFGLATLLLAALLLSSTASLHRALHPADGPPCQDCLIALLGNGAVIACDSASLLPPPIALDRARADVTGHPPRNPPAATTPHCRAPPGHDHQSVSG